MKNYYLLLFILFRLLSYSQIPSWNISSTNYATSYNFDANGNISSINRNAYGSNDAMDKLTYYYNDEKNQLNYVADEENVKFTTDLNTQTTNNYEYDKLGRLIKDAANGINKIEYTIFNKPYKIYKSNGDTIQYMYDAYSNKVVQEINSSTGEESITYYTLTSAAQINGVYSSSGSDIALSESHISDLVTINRNEDINSTLSTSNVYTRSINKKKYPLHDHLGSVRAVLSDKMASETEASIVEEATYYPYGMQVPGMSYQTENSRFGFQGKELLTAMTDASGSHIDFGARINDVRIAQWTSIDPLESNFPNVSPYNSMGNNPINRIDPNGMADVLNQVRAYTQEMANVACAEEQYWENGRKESPLIYAAFPILTFPEAMAELKCASNTALNYVIPTEEDIEMDIKISPVTNAIPGGMDDAIGFAGVMAFNRVGKITRSITRSNIVGEVIRYANRDILVVEIDGVLQAFYRSTGVNSKKPDKWLPFDGITSNIRARVWFDKAKYQMDFADKIDDSIFDGNPLNDRYGNDYLRSIAESLDAMGLGVGQEMPNAGAVNKALKARGIQNIGSKQGREYAEVMLGGVPGEQESILDDFDWDALPDK